LEQERAEKEEQIQLLESHYKDQLDLKKQISPRAIAGGWEEQINNNLRDTRERITDAKLDLLFRIQIRQKKVASELQLMRAVEDDTRQSFDHWREWYQIEQDRLWQFQRQHNREVADKELRHSIITEQLKWKVRHCVACGKPDKRMPLLHVSIADDRVQQLVDVAKEQADEYQALAHAENTFKPFQKMMDTLSIRLNELDSADRIRATQANNPHFTDSTSQRKNRSSSKPMDRDRDLNHDASLYPQQETFPARLPWNLMEKVREERHEIITSLKPK
jgi:YesN/AraC family two-component response regulator